jgi:hypothetical protein
MTEDTLAYCNISTSPILPRENNSRKVTNTHKWVPLFTRQLISMLYIDLNMKLLFVL